MDNALIHENEENNSRAIEYWNNVIQVINNYNEQDKNFFIGSHTIKEIQSRIETLEKMG